MTTPAFKSFSTVQVKYTLYAVSDFHQLMKCNDHQVLQISRSFIRLALLQRRVVIKKRNKEE